MGGVGSSPGASGSTFFVGNRPVKVCKKLALSVCEDMRLPQRSMAYGWDEWNGDNKVSGGATKAWSCTFFLITQGNSSAGSHTPLLHTFVISCTDLSHMKTPNKDRGHRTGSQHMECCTHDLKQTYTYIGSLGDLK